VKGLRTVLAAVFYVALVNNPACAGTTPTGAPLGIVLTADHARVGQSPVDVGTTIYVGDSLNTGAQGNVQVRAGAARLLLLSSTTAVVNDNDGTPSAKLVQGTVVFSTGNSRAFTLFASQAAIVARTDAPTIGQVTYVSDTELVVLARRGDLLITVADESQVIHEGNSYRVLIDPTVAQEPAGAGTGNQGPMQGQRGGPLRAGRSRFTLFMIVAVAAATTFAAIAACESPFNW
jgi:hypothetical protein